MGSHAFPRRLSCLAVFLGLTLVCDQSLMAQMVTGRDLPGFSQTMGVAQANERKPYSCQFISSSAPGNILWPDEQATFTFQLVNNSAAPLTGKGKAELISYGTKGRPGEVWITDMFRNAVLGSVDIDLDMAPGKSQNFTVQPDVPNKLGPYALIVDLGTSGRRFVACFVRTFKADATPIHFPQLALDVQNVDVLIRLGACPNRLGISFKPPDDPDFKGWFAEQCKKLDDFKAAKLPITVEFGAGDPYGPTQPLGRIRPWLTAAGVMIPGVKSDYAWLPSYDPQFKKLVKMFLEKYGWPRGPIIAVKFQNEPWDGISISGWGADIPRYREIYDALCQATLESRKEFGEEVLLGGCDSSTNTMDKFFSDGTDAMLQYLDFCSIHYQGMMAPSTIKAWVNRTGPNGRVKIWDTESWVANCDDRVAGLVAANLSAGYDRAVGIFGGNICTMWDATGANIIGDNGKNKRINVTQTWSVAASVGAANHFIGERKFKELLFKNGLPWVMVLDGLPDSAGQPNIEDSSVVVVGDIGEEFGHDELLFRNAKGFAQIAHRKVLQAKLAALPTTATENEHTAIEKSIEALADESLSGATMTLTDDGGKFGLYDFYGNPVPPDNAGKIIVPLDGRGFFLRGNGSAGSFAALLAAIQNSRIDGIEPLAKRVRDMLSPVDQPGSYFRLELTNVLNRSVTGTLTVDVAGLKVDPPTQSLQLAPNETKEVRIGVSGEATPNNTYAMKMLFDAGQDGQSELAEDIHVNMISHRTITVDGDLSDWKGVLPQIVVASGNSGPTLTQKAWLPFEKFDTGTGAGIATGYLAYDDHNFYFAAKVADSTPDGGTMRFAARDDDQFFYPEKCQGTEHELQRNQTAPLLDFTWPDGVRRYSYRKDALLPCGSAPPFDNVQIAFNVLDSADKWCLPNPPGTMPGYIGYQDTDYEYALNMVSATQGGGTEIWRLQVPGMPRKQFYPREPKSPLDGPVNDGKLAIDQGPTTRIEECAIPWSELPDIKKKLDAGQTIKFSFRVNDNRSGSGLELSKGRSVAKVNALTFHPDWVEHWSNEVEFAFEK
jgi:hypothetical protein